MEKLKSLMQKYENYLKVAEPISNLKMPIIYAQRHEEAKAKALAAAAANKKVEKKEKKVVEDKKIVETPVEQQEKNKAK